jgi:penicillin-binding protein 2
MIARIRLFRYALLVGFGMLALRLGYLQLLRGGAYRRLAEKNCLRLVSEPAPRGLILDRHGHALATNRRMFRVSAIPQEAKDRPKLFATLSPLVGVDVDELELRFRDQRSRPFLPATLVRQVSKPVALRVEEARLKMPGIVVESLVGRRYPRGSVAAHLLGYVGQPSSEVFPTLKQYGVQPQDLIGREGLELELDAYLRGQPGGSMIEVDSLARQVQVRGHREPVPGKPVTLTIDADLSALIEKEFGPQPGAAVVLKPQTGELLAMVSVPSFLPETFANQESKLIQALLDDEERSPLMNRATNGAYLPGSIVKIITAMTALERGIVTRQTTVQCMGQLTIGNRDFHCWNLEGHGPVRVREALMSSCNVYFMEVGRRLGLDRLRSGMMGIGFGRPTGWLLGDHPGHLPDSHRLSDGEVALLAIGQGQILISPLQAAIMVSAVANRGWVAEPWVISQIEDHRLARPPLRPIGWSRETIATVLDGMNAVVNDPNGGTGIRAHSELIRIVGKTGTAQTGFPGKTHGWFVGFCPMEEPLAAMAIVAEHGGSGGDLPAAVAKSVCEYLAAPKLQNTSDHAV